MSYYPKNRIQTNLYTNGGKLIVESSGQDYKGFYYKTFDNSYYAGKDNSVPLVIKLIENPKPKVQGKSSILNTIKNEVYQKIKSIPFGKTK